MEIRQERKYQAVWDLLGLPPPKSTMTIDLLQNRGIAVAGLKNLINVFGIPKKTFAEFMPFSPKTLDRLLKKPDDSTMKKSYSDHIFQVADLFRFGLEVFGDKEQFVRWLKTPTIALSNRCPGELLKSATGIQLLKDELGRIEYGIIA